MDWLAGLRGMVVGLDTAPFIYYVEEDPVYFPVIDPFFAALGRNEFHVVTSIVSLAEVLVHPLRSGDTTLADEYRALLLYTDELTCVAATPSIAERTAHLRSQYRIRTPDALQVATAIHMGASIFVTNDGRLPNLPEITVFVLKHVLNNTGAA